VAILDTWEMNAAHCCWLLLRLLVLVGGMACTSSFWRWNRRNCLASAVMLGSLSPMRRSTNTFFLPS